MKCENDGGMFSYLLDLHRKGTFTEPEVCSELHPELLFIKLAPSQLSYYCTTVYFAIRTNSLVGRCTAKLLRDTISETSHLSGCATHMLLPTR